MIDLLRLQECAFLKCPWGVSAMPCLRDALARTGKDADALANMYVACQHLGKNSERALTALRSAAPEHPLLQKRGALEADFRRVAAQYS